MTDKNDTPETEKEQPEIVEANPKNIPVCDKAFDPESSRMEDPDDPCFNGEA